MLGMTLQPGFDLADPAKRNLFVYYSPRNDGVAHHRQRPGRRLQPDQPLHAQRGRHRGRRRLRARDPARAQGQDRRLAVRLPRAARPTRPRPRRRRRPGLRLRRQPVPRRRRRRRRRTRAATTATRRWTSAPRSAGTRARRRRTPPTCAARSSASSRLGDIPADAEPGRRHDVRRSRRATCSPAGHAKTRPEIYAMGFRQPFTLHTDPANPGIVGVGEYCHDNSANAGQPRSRGHLRVEPDRQAGQLRLAVLRRQQLAGEHDVPLELHDQRVDRPAVRLLAAIDAVGHPLRAGRSDRRSSRPTTVWTRFPARSPGDDLEEVHRRRRQPERRGLR